MEMQDASHWLNVITQLLIILYDLSPSKFRDDLSLRYGHETTSLPERCDGFNELMNVCHALNCIKGSLVEHGHDYVQDNGA